MALELQNKPQEVTNAVDTQFITSLPQQLTKLRILDEYMVGHKGYIAGGCFKFLFMGKFSDKLNRLSDVDVFFETYPDLIEGEMYFANTEKFNFVFSNGNVKRFRHKEFGTVVELILSRTGKPENMISSFDFTITKAAYTRDEDGTYKFLHHPKFFEHLLNQKLVIDNDCPFPLSTFNRTYKYRDYGFRLCGESKQKLVAALQGQQVTNTNDFYAGID